VFTSSAPNVVTFENRVRGDKELIFDKKKLRGQKAITKVKKR